MDNLTFANVIAFFILFFGLCCFVFFAIAILNIYRQSYKPQETVLVLLSLIVLFIANSAFLILSVSRIVEGVTTSLENPSRSDPVNQDESLF